MTPASLKSYSTKDLAQMARQGGVRGWHSMRKDQLIKALLTSVRTTGVRTSSVATRTAKKPAAPARRAAAAKRPVAAPVAVARQTAHAAPTAKAAVGSNGAARSAANGKLQHAATNGSAAAVHATSNGHASNGQSNGHSNGHANGSQRALGVPQKALSVPQKSTTSPRVLKHLQKVKSKLEQSKNLSTGDANGKRGGQLRDRIVVLVRDSFWLHVYWELTRQSVDRAQAAMGENWHMARPCLRLLEISEGGATNASERVVEDITIHGGVSNWYVHVDNPPKSYRVEIGYLAAGGKFFSLGRSNVVTTPAPGTSDAIDEHWSGVAENFDKIYAMSGGYSVEGSSVELQELFEERLRRPMGSPMMTRYGEGLESVFPGKGNFKLDVDAEMIVYGTTEANAHLSVRGEPVKLRPDGSFTLRMSLPNQRQVIPVVACAANGGEQRTIVLAVERNTKVMEPVLRESND